MELVLMKYQKAFVPDEPQNEFKDGGQYTLMELQGNDLIILNDNEIDDGRNLKWIPVS